MSNPPTCLAVDYGSTISTGAIDHLIGQKPVDPEAAAALRILHDDLGMSMILASNTQPNETRWPALQKAGIDHLFRLALLSYPLGVRILSELAKARISLAYVVAAAIWDGPSRPASMIPSSLRLAASTPAGQAVEGSACAPVRTVPSRDVSLRSVPRRSASLRSA